MNDFQDSAYMEDADATPPEHEPEEDRTKPKPAHSAFLYFLLCAFMALCVHGIYWDSPTVDEFAHLPAGYYYLKTGNFELFSKNPPLIKTFSALPLLALKPYVNTKAQIKDTGWYPWIFGTDFMEHNRKRYVEIFACGRLMIVGLGILTGLLVYHWAKKLYGAKAGLTALCFYVFCPTIIAHAHLATVDLGVSLFILLTLYLFHHLVTVNPTHTKVIQCGIALGFAVLSKYTAILLYPLLLFLTLIALGLGERFAIHKKPQNHIYDGLWSIGSLCVIFLVSLFVINAGYLFQDVGTSVGDFTASSAFLNGTLKKLPSFIPLPFPEAFLHGFDALRVDTEVGEFPNYLFGLWSKAGFENYFGIAILFKTPLILLLAFIVAPMAENVAKARGEYFLWLPILMLILAFSFLSKVNYGIRYILPIFPLLCIYSSRLVPFISEQKRAFKTFCRIFLWIYPLSALLSTPNTLAYFNVLAGKHPDHILLDSNIDWGQGLKQLKTYMDKHNIERIGLAYFGHVDPAIYGLEWGKHWDFPENGSFKYIAVSANFLHGYPYATYWQGNIHPIPSDKYTWLKKYRIIKRLGGGLLLLKTG